MADDEQEKCTCKEMDNDDLHTCPYQQDVNDDSEFLCACCPYCQQQCTWDI